MIAQQLADVSLEFARMQVHNAVVLSAVVYVCIIVTGVVLYYLFLETRPEDKAITSSQYDLLKVMISSESAHRRKAQAELEATIGAVRTMAIGHKALNEKVMTELDKYKAKADRNFKVLDKRTTKKDKPKDLFMFGDISTQIEVPAGSELNKELVKKVAKQVKDF